MNNLKEKNLKCDGAKTVLLKNEKKTSLNVIRFNLIIKAKIPRNKIEYPKQNLRKIGWKKNRIKHIKLTQEHTGI